AAGASADEAATIARHMAGANLAGHDSHGVQLLPTYVGRVRGGDIVPGAPFEVLDETATTARVDGHWGFGQVVSERAMTLAIAMATSAAAGNKIAVYRSRGQQLPPGWIVDRDGNPSTDPQDYLDGGALLPLGGGQGHKGYGLGFMVEVFTGILTGLGFGVDPS